MNFEEYFKYKDLLKEQAGLEANGGPRAKLSYLEDLVIEKGKEGFNLFKAQIEQLLIRFQNLDTDQIINSKIDGSPGILFGRDPRPAYNSQFFVGVGRSINGAKTPKAIHNELELNKFVSNEDLKKTLKSLLINLREAYDDSGNIYQADVLFSNHLQKSKETIEGVDYLTFTPNLLTYAVPIDPKSDLYNRILKAEVGIVVHEICRGSTDLTRQQIILNSIGKGKDAHSLMEKAKSTGKVFIESSTHQDVMFDVPGETLTNIEELIAKAEKANDGVDDLFNEQWVSHPLLKKLHKYMGDQIKKPNGGIFFSSKNNKNPHIQELYQDFAEHLMFEYKLPKKRKEVMEWLQKGITKTSIMNLLSVFFYIRKIVDTVLDVLYSLETKLGKSFVKLPDGSYQVSRGEGFVLFHGNNHAKLVDRLDFTRSAKLYSKYN